jgi:HD-like signal output (HDOD) protein
MKLNDLLATQFVLPSIPKVVALLLSELGRDDPDLKKINQLISTDPALTTRLLQTANSGDFNLAGKINSVSESLAVLHLAQVRAMVQTAAAAASLKAIPGIQLQSFWTYSLNVARSSRSLAGLVRQNQQAAFTSGLLHAMGELALHLGMPQELAKLDNQIPVLDLLRAKLEQQTFGFCYAQVGAGFARRWGLPESIVDAIEHQDAPFEGAVYEPLAGVIHLAVWRARAKEANFSANVLAVTFPGEVGDVLGLDIDMVLQQDPIDWPTLAPLRKPG